MGKEKKSNNTQKTQQSEYKGILFDAELKEHFDKQLVDKAISKIINCDFVALDLEFTGLCNTSATDNTLSSHYEASKRAVEDYMTVQLGVCAAYQPFTDDDTYWDLSAYTFFLLPTDREFLANPKTLLWLKRKNFSFDEWIVQGLNFARLGIPYILFGVMDNPVNSDCIDSSVPAAIPCTEVQRIFDAISKYSKTVVFHQGFLDALHIYDKFIDTLPEDMMDFMTNWHLIFAGGTFDTKLMAGSRIADLGDRPSLAFSSLAEIRQILLSKGHYSQFILGDAEFSDELKRAAKRFGTTIIGPDFADMLVKGELDFAHEAGFDAFCTAQVFILELECICLNKRRNKKKHTKLTDFPSVPRYWRTFAGVECWKNKLLVRNKKRVIMNLNQ